jgi:hypothetical protein
MPSKAKLCVQYERGNEEGNEEIAWLLSPVEAVVTTPVKLNIDVPIRARPERGTR